MGQALRTPQHLFGKGDTRIPPVVETVVSIAARLFPVKTARHLGARAGVSHRSVEAWIAGSNGLSADALAELLRSDIGFEILRGVMGPARPSWWPSFAHDVRVDALERRAAEAHRELREMRRAEAGRTAASTGRLFQEARA